MIRAMRRRRLSPGLGTPDNGVSSCDLTRRAAHFSVEQRLQQRWDALGALPIVLGMPSMACHGKAPWVVVCRRDGSPKGRAASGCGPSCRRPSERGQLLTWAGNPAVVKGPSAGVADAMAPSSLVVVKSQFGASYSYRSSPPSGSPRWVAATTCPLPSGVQDWFRLAIGPRLAKTVVAKIFGRGVVIFGIILLKHRPVFRCDHDGAVCA